MKAFVFSLFLLFSFQIHAEATQTQSTASAKKVVKLKPKVIKKSKGCQISKSSQVKNTPLLDKKCQRFNARKANRMFKQFKAID
ncbi:hypothetical protein [Algicola sagamiensis]|uniref:hypothetical protein n=1 Tax=Algicola sagamiensis TaxID=163869 RepID=UPI00035DDC46|nr:hypothetical protein [Algicola sagamiensis]